MFWAGLRRHLSRTPLLTGFCILYGLIAVGHPQEPKPSGQSDPNAGSPGQPMDPLQRPLSSKQQKAIQKRASHELSEGARRWIDQDVVWIITPEERAAFAQLSNDEERDQFIEAFWQRRDPTPDTPENEYKEEHYRRITYANEHFGAGIPGWKTDRGRIYIMHGPPDEIESHPSGGTYDRPVQQGGGTTSSFPFEDRRYRFLDGVGENVVIEFVDSCMCGDYHMTMDPNEKDALAHTPMGQTPNPRLGNNSNQFEALEQFVGVNKPPKVRFKDLSEVVSHKVNINLLPFDVLANFVKVTSDTVLVPITVQIRNRDLTFTSSNGVDRATVNIFGRLTTLSGRVAQTFEDTVQIDVPHDLLARAADNLSIYGKSVPLSPGHYRLDVVAKDVNGDRVGTWYHSVVVPAYSEDQLATSSLIVADRMEKAPSKNIGTGSFVIGDMYIRPRLPGPGKPATFKRNQKISFWMQVYNLSTDEKTHRPLATIEYDVISEASGKALVHSEQSASQLGSVGDQITLQKTLSAADLPPGLYTLRIRVNDSLSGQTVEPSTPFAVE